MKGEVRSPKSEVRSPEIRDPRSEGNPRSENRSSRAEDTWGFLADGSGSYENVAGIVQTARDNSGTVALGAGKTKPSDATLADLRAVRTKVNKAALNGKLSAYYMDSTWETFLPSLNSVDDMAYQRLPNGEARLDGYPIVWTDVLTPYGTDAAADDPLVVFGALGFWWMGEHGSPRIDTSDQVWFVNDQLAVRFIEEIDFDYAAVDATANVTGAPARLTPLQLDDSRLQTADLSWWRGARGRG